MDRQRTTRDSNRQRPTGRDKNKIKTKNRLAETKQMGGDKYRPVERKKDGVKRYQMGSDEKQQIEQFLDGCQ